MAKNISRRTVKGPHTKKQVEALKALETAAKKSGLKVSVAQLRFAGLKLRGGSCLLKGRQWLILDKTQPFEDLVDIYRQALPAETLSGLDLPPEVLEIVSSHLGGAAKEQAA
ncbi:hypothetical protein LJB99_05385 [Deltaproteobacteria bacterium OttesenSCG-928-K17]|nr:hypothetical protein [Deltaproteobacteria bacterium OttesenSCG-928-K17]